MTRSKIIPFQDGDETISVRLTEHCRNEFSATDAENFAIGYGYTELSAMADLFRKLPMAVSEREERRDTVARWDRARDLRKHEVA